MSAPPETRQESGAAAAGAGREPAPPPFDYATVPVEPGRVLVEASAGTGKTFAIAGLCLRLVLEGAPLARDASGLPDLRRLLVVTFTRAATAELRGRIRAALRAALAATRGAAVAADAEALVAPFRGGLLDAPEAPARLQAALDRVDEAAITTIHGFCKRTLDTLAFESGTPFGLDFTDDDGPLRRRAAADAWTALVHDQPALAALAVRRGWTPEALLDLWTLARRYPGTELRPPAPPLPDALAGLDDARRHLAEVWSDEAADDALGTLAWGKNAPHNSLPDLARRVALFAERADTVDAVLDCAPDAVAKHATTRSKAQKEAVAAACEHPAVQACGAVAEAVATLRLALIHRFIHDVDGALAAIKRRRGVIGNDDLLTRLHDALDPAAPTAPGLAREIKARVGVAIVDEFQDTDPVQYGIFRRAFGDAATGGLGPAGTARPVVFVGDPKQAIYAFRGADLHAYLGAQAEAPRRYTLGRNWRTAAPLVEAVNGLFGAAARPFVHGGIPFRPAAGRPAGAALAGDAAAPLVWWALAGEEGATLSKDEARAQVTTATVGEIVRLLGRGLTVGGRALSPRDIAVLVNKNAQVHELKAQLAAAGVPAAASSAGDIRHSREMREVELLLHGLARPHDERAVRAALATELLGWGAARLAALADDEAAAVRERFREAQLAWRRHGVLRALTGVFEAERVAARLLALADGERRMTNLRHVLEVVHAAERAAHRSPEDLLQWIATRDDHALGDDRTEIRLERDDQAVQIATVHKSKGLEYEVVFLPFLWDAWSVRTEDGALAHVDGRPVLHLEPGAADAEPVVAALQAEDTAERLRKAYVALTRARERCYVAWGGLNGAQFSPLGYLLLGHGAADGDPATVVAGAIARAKGASGQALAALHALADGHDAMEVVALPDGPPPRDEPDADAPALLGSARTLGADARARAADLWRPASFSAWSAGARRADDALAAAPADRPSADEPADGAPPSPGDAPGDAEPEAGVHAFAAGRGPGLCLHGILEAADLSDPDGERMAARVALALQRYGLAAPRHHRAPLDPAATVHALLRRVAAVPIGGVPLGELARRAGPDRRPDDPAATLVPEWRFVLGLGRTAPRALAEAFRAHAAPALAPYADALGALSPDAAEGVLTGIADLKAEADGRWHIVDWKSNRLGASAAAYAPEALDHAMREHHYVLQYHLYLVGLHRFLRARLGDAYDYDAHVGGAHYVFLRGLADAPDGGWPEGAPVPGVVSDRPPRALVDALDRALGHAA